MRTPHGKFTQYHTSGDNLDFVDAASLGETFNLCMSAFHLLENNGTYLNRNPKCEPQLGKRGLYGSIGGRDVKTSELAMLWVLNFSDGEHDLLDIAERSGMAFSLVSEAAEALSAHGLLHKLD
jgi:aminopeptidase-like protein